MKRTISLILTLLMVLSLFTGMNISAGAIESDAAEIAAEAETTESATEAEGDLAVAAKCDRELIKKGCEMLGMTVNEVADICINGMRPYADDIGLLGTEA
ncbi:MAG: hypothetical protein IJG87_03335 [Ruminococcus sp.]|nr:hypothetical protein [Ruminococcus sp.]